MKNAFWRNLEFSFEQEEEWRDLKREVLDGGIYYFETERREPIIIDGGAHVGLATLYWKWLYPEAKIWAFEPNPHLFALLQRNLENNQVQGVTAIQAALGKHEGEAQFWIDATAWAWWSVGSFHRGAWNGEQKDQEVITVKSVQLKTYVQKLPRVDLLKLDVEGAESMILRGLGEELEKVQHLIFEFHPTGEQRLEELLAFLQKRGLQTRIFNRKGQTLKSWHEKELVLVEAERESE